MSKAKKNQLLAKQIQTEILSGEKTRAAIMFQRQNTIKFFVRGNTLQKSYPNKEFDLLVSQDDDEELLNQGIKYSTLRKIAQLVGQAIERDPESWEHGYIYIHYVVDPTGEKLNDLKMNFESEIHHPRF